MTDQTENVQFVSTCITTVIILSKEDFLNTIQKYSNDFEIYCKIKHQAKNLGQNSVLDSKCETCGLFTHSCNKCPQVNY